MENNILNSRRRFLKIGLGYTALGMTVSLLPLTSCNKNDNVYAVNSSKCTGCGKCVSVCPANAISLSNSKASINSSACRGCGRCASVCTKNAIYQE